MTLHCDSIQLIDDLLNFINGYDKICEGIIKGLNYSKINFVNLNELNQNNEPELNQNNEPELNQNNEPFNNFCQQCTGYGNGHIDTFNQLFYCNDCWNEYNKQLTHFKEGSMHYLDIQVPTELLQCNKLNECHAAHLNMDMLMFLHSEKEQQIEQVISYWLRLFDSYNLEYGIIKQIKHFALKKNAHFLPFTVFYRVLLSSFTNIELRRIRTNQILFCEIFRYYLWSGSMNDVDTSFSHSNIEQIMIEVELSYDRTTTLTLYSNRFYYYHDMSCNRYYGDQYKPDSCKCEKQSKHSGVWMWDPDELNIINLYGYGFKYNPFELIHSNEHDKFKYDKYNLKMNLTSFQIKEKLNLKDCQRIIVYCS